MNSHPSLKSFILPHYSWRLLHPFSLEMCTKMATSQQHLAFTCRAAPTGLTLLDCARWQHCYQSFCLCCVLSHSPGSATVMAHFCINIIYDTDVKYLPFCIIYLNGSNSCFHVMAQYMICYYATVHLFV